MIGDSVSDILFGNRLKMKTIFVETNEEEVLKIKQLLEEEMGFNVQSRIPGLAHFSLKV